MYSFPNFEPVICSMWGCTCCFLTRIQVSQEGGNIVWYSYLFKNCPQKKKKELSTIWCGPYSQRLLSSQWNKSRGFLESLCILYDPRNFGYLMYGSSAFSKPGLYIWKSSIQVLLKPSLKVFEHNLTSMGSECNCLVVWMFFSTSFLWSWDGKLASSFYSNYTPI